MKPAILLLALLLTVNLHGQANDFEGAVYNIGIGSVFSTIGAIINKKENVSLGATIKKSLWQGAVGGYLNFEAKRLLRKNVSQDDWKLYWGANMLNSLGASIAENAAYNRGMFEQLNWHIAFVRLEFHLADRLQVEPKVMMLETGSFVYNMFAYDFEAGKSLKTGQMVFSADFLGDHIYGMHDSGNILVLKSQLANKKVYAHEIVHRFQRDNYITLNSYYNPSIEKWLDTYTWGRVLNKYVYLDLHNLVLLTAYQSFFRNDDDYYGNIFEHEAGYYSRTLYFYTD